MSPAMYGGGKGGSMPQMPGGAGKGGSGGGFGGLDMTNATISSPPSMALPDAPPPPVAQPAAPAAQGPNAFDQGLGAQNSAMDFFQTQMGGGPQNIMDMINNMSKGGGFGGQPMYISGGGSGPDYKMNTPGQELYDYDPAMVDSATYQAAQLSDADIDQYMNPYTQNVIDTTMADLDKARLNALNSTGAAASRGGAFGGDRHGIMEAQNNADYLSQVARSSAQLRNQGYQNAQNAALSDINALNQQRGTNAAMAQQAAMANAAANNERSQFVGSTANSNALAAEQARLQMAMRGGGGGNSGAQYQQMAQLKAQQQQNALQAAMAMYGMQMDSANQLYGMGQDRFGMGQDALNSMGQVGSQIDNINQSLIDQQYQMFMNQQNAPFKNYDMGLGALGALSGAGTQTYNPGKMDYLQMGAGLGGAALMSDISLKDDLKPVAKINGFQLYTWKWNEKAREIGCDHEPTFGVVAQEVRELRPEAILEGSDGYLMVDYRKLPEIARTVAMGGQ